MQHLRLAHLALALLTTLAGCVGELSEAPGRRTSPPVDGGTPIPPGVDAWVPPGVDAWVPPGVDGGPPPGPIDSGIVVDPPDAFVPAPLYPSATIGTRCSEGAEREFLVLSSEPADCMAHARSFTTPDATRFVPVQVGAASPFTTTATMCSDDGACAPTSITVTLTRTASGATGEWSATVGGIARTGRIEASRCDYDALLPPAGETPIGDAALREVAIYQGVKITIAREGAAVAPSAPIVAGRDALLRLFVEPRAGFVAREVVARVELGDGAPIEVRGRIQGSSTDADLASTLNVRIPGDRITPEVPIAVGIYDVAATCGGGGATGGARFPSSGTATLAARSNGGTFRVVLVPVRYAADGSNRLPDTSAANVAAYRDFMRSVFPVQDVEITVRSSPLVWNGGIGADGSGWSQLLNECMNLRQSDRPPADTYYYCLFSPASSFSQFCGRGCVAGLGPVPSVRDTFSRASIGLGYRGTEDTFVHEVGHSLGRPHAPCGGASGAEASYPYSGGRIGSWGYDLLQNQLLNPSQHTDVMGYCDNQWISDYNYRLVFERIRGVRGIASVSGTPTRYATVVVDVDGSLSWGSEVELVFAPDGDALDATWATTSGEIAADATLLPVSHVDGGIVYVPVPDASVTAITIPGYGTLAVR
ncbi:M66 family metalloprotease [Sandaracinus amylolyticus]|uniref:Uncharacterized protein n=1 Tax=Sandaracinus amylolyticus TaxID=927083 RepID=A0A0F6W8Y3_9BACT|nr:M66 family metalloprotease [Sandaracinus amylolyticus]AKF10468.1 hypothetical protein DB32_007617 [Sandaracinus amylolyticus]